MPNRTACVIWDRCRPERCGDGACPAVKACPRRLLKQEALFGPPVMDASVCRACGDCARACPLQAIEIRDT